MKILVVGGGGREHAIIRALKKSPDCGDIWCAPGNGGIGYDATCKNISATDVDAMVAFAKAEAFDYVVVAQDDPLALGMVDALAKVGIPAFGPDAAAARIEASKVFSKASNRAEKRNRLIQNENIREQKRKKLGRKKKKPGLTNWKRNYNN